jgi:hypothetical protein
MSYLGDYVPGDIIDFKFNTRAASSGTAVPFALASGAVQIFKSNSTLATTAGLTLTSTFASVVGLNHCRIESTADSTFFASGGQFEGYLSAGTVNSVSVVGELVCRFTMRAQASLYPTVAGRTLDVSAGGEGGVDWANVGSPTTVQVLSGTTIKTATDVETDTADIQARLPAALTAGGNMKSDALALSGDTAAADNAEAFFDGTGYAGTNNVIPTVTTLTNKTGFALAAGGVGNGAIAAAELNNIADAHLDRNMATGTDSGTDSTAVRTPRQAYRVLRNKVGVAAGTATVTKEDDSTTSWTAAVATAAGNPISEVDPT